MRADVEAKEIIDDKDYWVCADFGSPIVHYWSEYLNGKKQWSKKPGIAIRYIGGEKLRKFFKDNPKCFPVEVPANADKRWRKREPVSMFKRNKRQ